MMMMMMTLMTIMIMIVVLHTCIDDVISFQDGITCISGKITKRNWNCGVHQSGNDGHERVGQIRSTSGFSQDLSTKKKKSTIGKV
ncbi:hypothetical protein ElyMa_000155200 [Elysia marginata]|uniref:Secreted protein n=1 Tax=Elysia marginata TaxID=1093978 RepID=A0AAV4EQL0_9GAST|nr:hypothetical protein ElyMa_000155200 [Elysia marginata]